MRILVTGANGQVGRALQSVSRQFGEIDFIFCDSALLDITDSKKFKEAVKLYRPDVCFNLAAYTAVDRAEDEVEKAFLVNAESLKYIAEICHQNKVVLLHLSTDFVFDGDKEKPYTVNDTPNPINVYGASKLKGEQFIQKIMQGYYIVRTSWVYSDFGHNFKNTMLRLASEKKEINVVNDQIGCPTDAFDLACYIVGLVEEKRPFGLYHFCGEKIYSWYDFAVEIFRKNNINIKVNPISTSEYPSKAKRPKYSVLSSKV
jgi:dTDP-4-dehydrorhamnose reductase